MNKTEKLLAARKKLKEFQLSKKSHPPANTLNDTIERVEDFMPPVIINSARYNSDIEPQQKKESLIRDDLKLMASVLTKFEPELNTSNDDGETNGQLATSHPSTVFQDTVDFSVEKLAYQPSGEENVVTKENVFTNKDPDECMNSTENYYPHHIIAEQFSNIHYQAQSEIMSKDGNDKKKCLKDEEQSASSNDHGAFVGSQSLQKEYLLQMTSAVTNVLTDTVEIKAIPQELASDLEQRNQFLASCLREQKELLNQLHVDVNQYKSRASDLETLLATKDAEFQGKLYRELNPLKEQLQLHAQTTGILVGEKAELTAALVASQATAKQKVVEVEELNGKLKSLQLQFYELERELNFVKNNSEDTGKVNHQLQASYNSLEREYSQVKQERDDLELETAELRQKLNVKHTELTNTQEELKEKTALLSLNELRMQQMTSSSPGIEAFGEQHHVVAALEQQLSQLMETLKAVSSERDEASSHYQNYVQQLNTQVTKLALQLEQTVKENSEMSNREHSLIQRLSDLERQIQTQNELIPEPLPRVSDDHKEQIDALQKSINELILERDSFRAAIYEKDSDIDSLKREIEELQEMRGSNAEASRLASAMEGERIAAARAVSQNQQLKQQLSEMQDAFVQLSNTKLDLTEKLQGERSIGKKLNARLNDTENNVEKLNEELLKKNSLLAELEKEKLHAAQIADQMQHYQAQSHHAGTLQQELHHAQERIEVLTKQNQQLINELNAEKLLSQSTEQNASSIERQIKHDDNSKTVNPIVEDSTVQISTSTTQTELYNDAIDTVAPITEADTETITFEAVKKLEERFKDTMERVAELSDEKQRLEHLVLQLQSETETIGEYVTLYQKQRSILQERAKEKEEAFRQLSEQRNQQQEQLHKLKMLVAELIKEKTINATTVTTDGDQKVVNHLGNDTVEQKEAVVVQDKTTSEILDLLTEIKECKDTCALEPNFHPCPWCSGKLITV